MAGETPLCDPIIIKNIGKNHTRVSHRVCDLQLISKQLGHLVRKSSAFDDRDLVMAEGAKYESDNCTGHERKSSGPNEESTCTSRSEAKNNG
jgi:hypothetical protein